MKSAQCENMLDLSGSLWMQKENKKFLGSGQIALLEMINEHGSITKAAKGVGISYKTAWDMVNLLNNMAEKPLFERLTGGKGGGGTTLTQAGKDVVAQYRIIQEEHNKFMNNLSIRIGDVEGLYQFLRRISMKVSARNLFSGTVKSINKGAVNAEVSLALKGDTIITAVVTNGAIDNLGLKEGMNAYAIIKASSVMVGTDLEGARLSARNMLKGTISKLVEGPVDTEVDMELPGGNSISAVITHGSSQTLNLAAGGEAFAFFKASSVILGVN